MNFQPVDEMSLRHLFSKEIGAKALQLRYLGPVLNNEGKFDTSPDSLILDLRSTPFKIRRCEFKFIPSSYQDFSHNGQFDIAVVWKLPKGLDEKKLLENLHAQNGCIEILIMSNSKALSNLPQYDQNALSESFNISAVKDVVLKRQAESIIALYIAAKLAPLRFDIDKVTEYLVHRFPNIRSMEPRGRANVVTCWLQTTPALIENPHLKSYVWSDNFNSNEGAEFLEQIITQNLKLDLPAAIDIRSLQA